MRLYLHAWLVVRLFQPSSAAMVVARHRVQNVQREAGTSDGKVVTDTLPRTYCYLKVITQRRQDLPWTVIRLVKWFIVAMERGRATPPLDPNTTLLHTLWEADQPRPVPLGCLIKHCAMKTHERNWDMDLYISSLGTRCRWVVSFMSRPLYPQIKSWGTIWTGYRERIQRKRKPDAETREVDKTI
jgi:hypothetical protein